MMSKKPTKYFVMVDAYFGCEKYHLNRLSDVRKKVKRFKKSEYIIVKAVDGGVVECKKNGNLI